MDNCCYCGGGSSNDVNNDQIKAKESEKRVDLIFEEIKQNKKKNQK